MADYDVENFEVSPVEGDDQVAVTITATDGSTWEYGIPFSRSTGRYQFEEVVVIETDFGEEFAEELTEKLDEVVQRLVE